MIDFTVETEIAHPPSDVFAYVTDPSKLHTWQTNTVSAEVQGGGPLVLGSRLRERHRAPGGKELDSVVEVAEFEPPRAFALRMVEGSLPLDAHIRLEPSGDGTRMAFRVHGQPTGAMRVMQPLLRLTVKRQFASYCATLKRILEAT